MRSFVAAVGAAVAIAVLVVSQPGGAHAIRDGDLSGRVSAAPAPAPPASCASEGGHANMNAIIDEAPTLVSSNANGKKFVVSGVSPPLSVLHMYGTPYEMGHAYGSLMKEEINELVPELLDYVYSEIDEYIKFLPPSWRKAIEQWGVQAALNLTIDLVHPYVAPEFLQEMQGVADGSGVSMHLIFSAAVFPELIQASCSMFGAWGDATMSSRGGELVQLRALDWDTNGPFQKFPVVLVYHPTGSTGSDGGGGENGHAYSVLTWAGLVGSITGMSSAQTGICEKVWIHYKGSKPRNGIPFTFLLRDILQYDNTVEAAVDRINNANRTCSIFVGVGNNKSPEGPTFRGIEYSHDEVNVYDDKNFPAYPPYHNLSNGLVFFDKHTQPDNNACLGDLLGQYYGNIDPINTYQRITSVFQTGDMHIAIYDYKETTMYVANASPMVGNNTDSVVKAYDRPFVKLDMKAAFDEPAPSR